MNKVLTAEEILQQFKPDTRTAITQEFAWAKEKVLAAMEAYNSWLSSPPIYKVRPEDIEWFSVERGEDEFEVEDCETCGGDGKETCNNPDHGFIEAMPGDVGRIGCPVCGHDPKYKVPNGGDCEDCNGTGKVAIPKKGNESKEQSPSVDRIKELAVDFAFENFPKSGVTYQDVIKLFDEWLSNNQYHQKRLLIHQPYK